MNQICKIGNKKVRIGILEEVEEDLEEEEDDDEEAFSSLSLSPLVFLLLIAYLCHFRANLGNYPIFDLTKLIVSFCKKIS